MTAEPDLLPLPEPVAVKYPDSGLRDDEHALRLWAAHGYDTGGEPLFSAEQLREAVAPLQAEVEALRAEVELLRRGIVPCDDDMIVPVKLLDEINASGAEWETRAERLAEALRGLKEREQRDEALLRQALEVLSRAHQAAMVQTLKARIPECAEFGGIAQDLDFVVAALRERLGEGAEP